MSDWPTIVGTFVIIFFLAHLSVKILRTYLKTLEGLTNQNDTSTNKSTSTSTTTNGVAGSAASYAASIKASTVKIQDELLISKYRTDYETVIINMEDNINAIMLQLVLSAKSPDNSQEIGAIAAKIAQLSTAKNALNDVMKYVDSQPS